MVLDDLARWMDVLCRVVCDGLLLLGNPECVVVTREDEDGIGEMMEEELIPGT